MAVDSDNVVAVAFVDFKKAFDSVSHEILLRKLERNFDIAGGLLEWIKRYLSERMQFTVLNGVTSDLLLVTAGIPQGSVLGPTFFTLLPMICQMLYVPGPFSCMLMIPLYSVLDNLRTDPLLY